MEVATGSSDDGIFKVTYDIPGKGLYTEAIVHKVKNGISANYTEAYMRRRDPDTMSIADNKPSDKVRFKDKYKIDFAEPAGMYILNIRTDSGKSFRLHLVKE